MNFSSKLIEDAVEAFAQLPTVGRKTALRLVLHLIDKDPELTKQLAGSITKMKDEIKECKVCHNLSDHDTCIICQDQSRNRNVICLVESVKDVMAIEETNQFSGRYHVLGGVISPLEGVGIQDLNLDTLFTRVEENEIEEVIMAISPTIDGETTMYYIGKQLSNKNIKVSTIARGISFGGELEYADGFTLGRSIASRLPYVLNNSTS